MTNDTFNASSLREQENIDFARAFDELRAARAQLARVLEWYSNADRLLNSADPSVFLAREQVRAAEMVVARLTSYYTSIRNNNRFSSTAASTAATIDEDDADEYPIADNDPFFVEGSLRSLDPTGVSQFRHVRNDLSQGSAATANKSPNPARSHQEEDPAPPYTSLPGTPCASRSTGGDDEPTGDASAVPATPARICTLVETILVPATPVSTGPAHGGNGNAGTPSTPATHTLVGNVVPTTPATRTANGGNGNAAAATAATGSNAQGGTPVPPSTPRRDFRRDDQDGPLRSPFPSQRHYAVTRGCRTGVYHSWNEARSYVHHLTGAVYQGFSSFQAALDTYLRLRRLGQVQVIRGPGDTDKEFGPRETAKDI